MPQDYEVPPDALDRDIVFQFFWRFAVFECALKREGYLRVGRGGGAQPDWDRFGDHIADRLGEIRLVGFLDAVKTLIDSSPRRQVVVDQKLAWRALSKGDNEADSRYIIRLVKTVRNNLFHGGKYPDGPIEEIARDRRILKSALVVLNGLIALHPGISRWVDEAA